MRRTGFVIGLVAAIALLASVGQGFAQTATTTTTTTLPPHPFSPASASCVRAAYHAKRLCRRSGDTTCRTDFETAYSKCFATGAGVTCAKRCVTRETSCVDAIPKTKTTCRQACHKALVRDVRACRRIADGDTIWAGADASCLTTAQANRDLCAFVCSQARRDCGTSLRFCIANCANL